MSSIFDELWESYNKLSTELGFIWKDWLRTNGTWFVPASSAVMQLVAEGVKIWGPQWIKEEYKKSKKS